MTTVVKISFYCKVAIIFIIKKNYNQGHLTMENVDVLKKTRSFFFRSDMYIIMVRKV